MPILTTLALGGITGLLLNKLKLSRRVKNNILSPTKNKHKIAKKQVMSPSEAKARHQQHVSFGAMGLLGLSTVTSPIVGLMGLPLLAYNYFYMMRSMRESYQKKGNLIVLIFDVLVISFSLFLGFFFMTSVLFAALFTTNRLIAKTEREAQTDFSSIFGELSDTVWLLQDGVEIEIPLNSLQTQDIIVIYAGDMIPVDGHVVSGEGMVDQHLLTGEAQPVEKKVGDNVLTSTLLVSGNLQVMVDKQGIETITGKIAQTLEHAATFKHKLQSRGDQIVIKGASRTMLASAMALPLIGANHAFALTYSGFGYQMRMAAPLMVLNYLRIASQNGVLIKDGRALDVLHQIDTIVFDKTGTLTEEIPNIENVIACEGFTEAQVLQYAASAEQRQKHPIAQAICRYAEKQDVSLLKIINIDYAIGHGLRVELRDSAQTQQNIMIGSERFIRNAGIILPPYLEELQAKAGEKGYSIVYIVSKESLLMGAIELRPALRTQAHNAIKALHDLGIKVYIISGDQEKPTWHLAQTLGIDHYFAETLPEDKAKHVEALQNEGHKVCFIGDGINDSVALQKADVSISLHGAATIAQDTAEIVLMTPDLLHLPDLIKISKELQQRMNYSELMNTSSGVLCVGGILVFGMGVSGAIALYSMGLGVNIFNAMLPLLKHPNKQKQKNITKKNSMRHRS